MEVKGAGGTVVFDGTYITIQRASGVVRRRRRDRDALRIPVAEVTAVHFRVSGPLVNGFIQFSVGGTERRTRAVMFDRRQQSTFEGLRAEIERTIGVTETVVAAPRDRATGDDDLVDQLRRLADLHREGALSDAEFQAAKTQLLGGNPPPSTAPPAAPRHARPQDTPQAS